MGFFEDQRKAKSKTQKLVFLFVLIIIAVSLSVGALFTSLLVGVGSQQSGAYGEVRSFNSQNLLSSEGLSMIAIIAAGVALVIVLITLFKTWRLKSKPDEICLAMGAKRVPTNTQDFKLKRYHNIVEEMSVASSVPMPLIYILEDDAINAFACGFDINSAAICVTRGCIDNLSREELQAVVAHEYSHILNGDMTINLRLLGMLAGLLFLYYIGTHVVHSARFSRRKEGNQAALIGIGLIILGLIGFLFGNLLRAAISRQREYLADASSVQFTRNPEGIAGALKKIAVHYDHGVVKVPDAEKASHMFLVNGIKKKFFSLATHPDIYDRIKAVDPNFSKKRFLETEAESILKKMQAEKEQALRKVENTKNDPREKLELLLPLFVLLQEGNSSLDFNENTEEELLRALVANSDPVVRSIPPEKKLELLEVAFGEIKSMDKFKREKLHRVVKEEIEKDGKFDFHEFIIYSYLRPALEDVELKLSHLKNSEFEVQANMILNFLWQMDKIELTETDKKLLSRHFPFKVMDKKELSYSKILKSFEKLRFASADQKEKLLMMAEKLVRLNHEVTDNERVVIKLTKQILSVPGVVTTKA